MEFEKSDRGRELLPRKQKKEHVHFSDVLMLQNAVDNFDDREGILYIYNSSQFCFREQCMVYFLKIYLKYKLK